MPKGTHYTKARDKAGEHLVRGFNLALDRMGRVPLGHHILDPRTMNTPFGAQGTSVLGETAGLPASDHIYTIPVRKRHTGKAIQSPTAAKAGKVVDPTAIEMGTAGDQTSIDSGGWHDTGGSFINSD